MKNSGKLSRALTIILVLALFLQGVVFADDLPFIDVSPEAWYYADVKTAYESGLINGRSATIFAPDENMTYAEAVKLAACMHQLKNDGKVTLTTGEPWYATYVDYAKLYKLITGDLDWDAKATRAGYMQIFAQVLPDLSDTLNTIADGSIPDVPMSHKNAAAIYKLYRHGIVQGVDELHNCNPESNIKRSEVAAILTRMMNESKRISFSLGGESPTEELKIAEQPKDQRMTKTPTENLTFSVKISGGKAPYTYKWCYQYESEKIEEKSQKTSDKTNSITLSVSDKRGVFAIWCVITDEEGKTVTSEKANALVSEGVFFTEHPKDQQMTISPSENLTFSVAITGGEAPYTYKWCYKYGSGSVETKSQTSSNKTDKITLNVVDNKGVFTIWCVVTDSAGHTAESGIASVIPKATENLTITQQPKDGQMTAAVQEFTFTVKISGGKAPYTYTWEYFYGNGSYATTTQETDEKTNSTTLDILQEMIDKYGNFKAVCVITDSSGQSVTSYKATVEGRVYTLYVTEHPKNQILTGDWDYFDFTVKIEGGKAPYTYEWCYRYGGETFESDIYTSNDKTHTATLLVDMQELVYYHGVFTVYCRITDSSGQTVNSKSADVTDADILKVTKHPKSAKLEWSFEFFGFTVEVSGGYGPYKYEWRYWYKGQRGYNFTNHESFSRTDEFEIGIDERDLYGSEPFTVYCIITDGSGQTVESNKATVTF